MNAASGPVASVLPRWWLFCGDATVVTFLTLRYRGLMVAGVLDHGSQSFSVSDQP